MPYRVCMGTTEKFQELSDAEFQALTTAKKLQYLATAVPANDTVNEEIAARVILLGEQLAKR